MKRLSKSASDISGCARRTHTTSPEEEAREFPGPQRDESAGQRSRFSAASTKSVPAALDQEHNDGGRKGRRRRKRTQSELEAEEKEGSNEAKGKGSSLGFLGMLKKRLISSSSHSRSSSRESDASGRDFSHPQIYERQQSIDQDIAGSPEVLRYRHRPPQLGQGYPEEVPPLQVSNSLSTSGQRPEIVRHVTPISSLPMALAQELELARLKEEEEEAKTTGEEKRECVSVRV